MFGLICLALASLLPVHAKAQTQGGLGIAAVVNDDVISMLDLNARISMVMESAQLDNTAENRMKIAPQVLRGLVEIGRAHV